MTAALVVDRDVKVMSAPGAVLAEIPWKLGAFPPVMVSLTPDNAEQFGMALIRHAELARADLRLLAEADGAA